MSTAILPRITRKQIKARVGEASLLKGEPYAVDGSVFDTKRQGSTLKARVQGRAFEPYRVRIRCDARGIAESECSCPVGGGGYCKHVAAVLLVWLKQADLFLEVEDLDTILESWGKDDLIALVHRMLRRAPELEILLETPPVGARGRGTGSPRTADFYRRQAETAFRLAGDDWRASVGVAQDLSAIRSLGDEWLTHDGIEAAGAVYEGLLAGILHEYDPNHDEEGEIGGVAGECCEGLGKCLAMEGDPDRRASMFKILFDFYRFDVDQGGYGFADEVPCLIASLANSDERRTVAGWVREVVDDPENWVEWSSGYRRRVWGALLLDLESDILDDEAYLEICRQTDRTIDAIERLLDRGRIDEARTEITGLPDSETLAAADVLLQRGQGEWAEQLVKDRAEAAIDPAMLQWLKRRALARKDRTGALALARQIFLKYPTIDGYQECRKLAGTTTWPGVRGPLLASLETKPYLDLRIEIAMIEKDYERAVELVANDSRNGVGPLAIRVADTVADRKPEAAIGLYRRRAEFLIDQQGRDNYKGACDLLARIRKLHRRIQDREGWIAFRDDLLTRNRRRRAFREEFQAAKLDR